MTAFMSLNHNASMPSVPPPPQNRAVIPPPQISNSMPIRQHPQNYSRLRLEFCSCWSPPPQDFTAANAPPSLIPHILAECSRVFPGQYLFQVTPYVTPRQSWEAFAMYHVEVYESYANGTPGPLLVVGEHASTSHGAYRNVLGLLLALRESHLQQGGQIPVYCTQIAGAPEYCIGCERPKGAIVVVPAR